MLIRSSLIKYIVFSIILGYLALPVQPATVRGRLRSYKYNTKCLRPVGQGNGAELEIVDCSDSSTDQIIEANGFKNLESEAGYIQFDSGGKCLSLNGFSSDNGVRLLIWDCVNQDNQKWSIFNGNSGGTFQLQLKLTTKCLTAENGGTYMDQYECYGITGAPHQYWTLEVIGDNKPNIPTGKGRLRSFAYNTKCLHAKGGNNGAELEIVDCSQSSTDQSIKMDSFQNIANEAAYVQFDVSGKCLSLNGVSSDNGIRLLIWDCVNQDNQKWKVINGDLGQSFQLQLKSSGKCLTAEDRGTYMDQYDCYGISAAPHQYWTIDSESDDPVHDGTVIPHVFYQLENANSPNNCLRYKDGSDASYALELATCDANDPSQRIASFTDFGDDLGFSGIQFLTTAKCVVVAGTSNSNGDAVGQHSCENAMNQRWRMENFDLSTGTFRIRTEMGSKCLTSEGGGSYMDIWDCYGKSSAPHQYWKQRNPNDGQGTKLRVLQNFQWPDKCLHPVGTSKENGATLELIDCDSIKSEESMNTNEWLNYDTTPGYVKFNGKCLSMTGFGSDNGVRLIQWDCADQKNQRWQIVNGDIDSHFQLKSEQSGKCLTAEAGGTYMDQWDCYSSATAPHQSWMIKTIGSGGVQHDESPEEGVQVENFFEADGGLLEMEEYPGKCLSVSDNSNDNEISLIDCNQFDSNQLFDHTDLLNFNSNPGQLKILGTGKCLSIRSDGHVKQEECDGTDLSELWFVVLGSLLGRFKLKSSQSTNCITSEGSGSYTDLTECYPSVSDSRRKRELSRRAFLRFNYKMSTPNNNKWFQIQSGYFSKYCLCIRCTDNWDDSEIGIHDCDENDERQQWTFEAVGGSFQNKFLMRNGASCLMATGTTSGKLINFQENCGATAEFVFKFLPYGDKGSLFSIQNEASSLCIEIVWYEDKTTGLFTDYLVQKQCNLVGWSSWRAVQLSDKSDDWKCGPNNGGKLCTGKYKGNCCSKYGGCGVTSDYCDIGNCDSRYGPCVSAHTEGQDMEYRCGPWKATFANKNGTCEGIFANSCCSKSGICGDHPEQCLAENCDPGYGKCSVYFENRNPDKCGTDWGNKKCSGGNTGQCCSKNPKYAGTCGVSNLHCDPAHCDERFGPCYSVNKCLWIGNQKKVCGDPLACCSKSGDCGDRELYCGRNCDAYMTCGKKCGPGLSTKSVGLVPEEGGICRSKSCSLEGEPCSIRRWCCSGRCVDDPANNTPTYKARKCVG